MKSFFCKTMIQYSQTFVKKNVKKNCRTTDGGHGGHTPPPFPEFPHAIDKLCYLFIGLSYSYLIEWNCNGKIMFRNETYKACSHISSSFYILYMCLQGHRI